MGFPLLAESPPLPECLWVVEAALEHKVRNQVETAYRRTDLFERRRRLTDDWAAYLAGKSGEPEAAPIRR